MPLIDSLKSALVLFAVALTLAGCASTGIWLEADTKDYIERLQTLTKGGVRVSTSVLSASESQTLYGEPLADKGIQPVWIEVENHDDTPYWFMSLGLDPYYIPASEAADFRADYAGKENLEDIAEEIIDYTDDAAFRAALEALPCCATNKKGTRNGDPLNLVIIGGRDDAFPALVRRGWHPTEATYAGSVRKMINSAMSGERYPYAPISPMYLYDRPQDLALQKARDNIHQRNHLRLWLSPMRYHGQPVWVGQISRDIGSRLTIHSPYLTTHKIDPDVDEALLALIADLAYSQFLAKLGLVKGVGEASKDAPRQNLTTDPYYTDGNRGALFFSERPTSLADIEFLPWEGKTGGMVEATSKAGKQ
jgi:hypothetical protein